MAGLDPAIHEYEGRERSRPLLLIALLLLLLTHDPEKACPALDAGWIPVFRKIMRKQ
jgi:hypothetical protein